MTHPPNALQRTRRILLVEDDARVRGMVARHLRRAGYEVIEALSAEEVLLELHRQMTFDVVLTDIHLPGLTGIELARLVLARSPLQPVIIITGDTDEGLAREALSHGAVGYLVKPFELFELDAAIGQALSRTDLLEATQALARAEVGHPQARSAGVIPAGWLRLADERSGAGLGHGYRVARVLGVLASGLPADVSHAERNALDLAARAHELGRLLGPPPGPVELACRSAQFLADLGVPADVVRVVRHLHEHWDGTGGPDRLAGNAIPLGSCVLAVADALDHQAATRASVGREPDQAAAAAIDVVLALEGTAFHPAVTRALREARTAIEAVWSLVLRRPGSATGADG
ncbi:MAG: response regulator [Gemmatimonadetes bacterium]|nr:response regulator [Gemmatimonadota bacterium]